MEKKNPKAPKKLFFLIFLGVAAVLGGFFYFRRPAEIKPEEKIEVSFFEALNEETENPEEINRTASFVYAQREVIDRTDQGENIYLTKFILTDSQGEKKHFFYEAEDLTYEMAYPYLGENILLLTEFGRQDNRALKLEGGLNEDIFIPPVSFGADFIVSPDEKMLGYLENQSEVKIGGELNFDFSYLLKVRNMESNDVFEFDPKKIKHGEIEFSQFLPVGFSSDNKKIYLFVSQFGLETSNQNPNGLYAIDIEKEEIEELYFSSFEEMPEKDLIVLLGVFPEQGFALVNRGPQISGEEKTVFRTQLQKLDLETRNFSDIYTDENNDLVGSGGKILSPDGKAVILLNDAYYDRGLSVYDMDRREKRKLTERGDFLTWLNDSKTIAYLLYTTSETEAGGITQAVELHSLNIETGEDYKIYQQESLDEGTGLNEIGDTFYSFIGSF